jgi:hypothetical protein
LILSTISMTLIIKGNSIQTTLLSIPPHCSINYIMKLTLP